MPPKRKSDARAGAGPRKQSKTDSADGAGAASPHSHDHDHDHDHEHNHEPKHQPFDWVCIHRHFFDFEAENEDEDEDEQLDEEQLDEKYNEMIKNSNYSLKSPDDFPDHKWILLWESWTQFVNYRQRARYSDPDLFGMYIYNDFHGYGLQEVIENILSAFNSEFKKKTRDEQTLKQMWAISAALGHWLNSIELGPWMMMDDGERVMATESLIGRSFLTILNELDLAKILKADSDIKDLGLVISLYIRFGADVEDGGDDEDDVNWRKELVAYARKAGVDLKATGCYGTEKRIESLEEEEGEITALEGNAKADRWNWKKSLSTFTKRHGRGGKIGGEQYNILKMSRKERADSAFNNKDPLADVSPKDLKEGNIMQIPYLSSGNITQIRFGTVTESKS